MSLEIILEDENGQELEHISDFRNVLLALINERIDEDSICLRFIDPYGDTVFNRLQMPRLLTELAALLAHSREAKQRRIIARIQALVFKGEKEPHLYIRFTGD